MSPAAGMAAIFVGDNIMYLVTFLVYGDSSEETFATLEDAIEFIQDNINNENYGDMRLYQSVPFQVQVNTGF